MPVSHSWAAGVQTMDILGVKGILEAVLPGTVYKSAAAPLGALTGVFSRASQPWFDAAALVSATPYIIGDAVQKLTPFMVEQLYSTAWTSPRKTMAPGSRVPMEVRSLDGNFYHIVLVGPMSVV